MNAVTGSMAQIKKTKKIRFSFPAAVSLAAALLFLLFTPSFSSQKPTALFLVNSEPATHLYSMGDIFSSGSFEDAFSNPWMLGLAAVPGASLAHWPGMISKSNYNFAGVVLPLKKHGAFSVNYLSYDVGEELLYELDGTSKSVKLEDDKMYSFGYGFPLSEKFFAGFQAKYLQSVLAQDYTASAVLCDAGLMFNTLNAAHTAGLSLKNYGQKLKYLSIEEPVPAQAEAGYTYNGAKWTVGFSYYYILDASQGGISAGIEYKPKIKLIRLRGGGKQVGGDMKYYAGLGINIGRVDFNLAYQIISSEKVSQEMPVMFSLNWFWGARDEKSLSKAYAARGMKKRAKEVAIRDREDNLDRKGRFGASDSNWWKNRLIK